VAVVKPALAVGRYCYAPPRACLGDEWDWERKFVVRNRHRL